ncbi:lytic transglycosylase domain-containing protein, partial [Patescibacteria group bacterium]|nr:lytic transglycosylase domain-containing protein [Patescibacteria group bacterium]
RQISINVWHGMCRWTPVVASAIWAFTAKWAPIVWSYTVIAVVWTTQAIWSATKFVGRLIRTTAINPMRQNTRVWLFGNIWGAIFCALMVTGFTIFYGPVESPVPEGPDIGGVDIDPPVKPGEPAVCGDACVKEIRNSRSKLRGIEKEELRYVLEEYNSYVASETWRQRAQSCHQNYWEHFQKAEEITLYPSELLAGKALIEGAGCKFITATNGDGGIGPMQITHPVSGHINATARLLGTTSDGVQYRSDYLHNVLLGAVMFSDFEDMFGSRGVGILAYNRGPGNVRRDMRRAGLNSYMRRVISDFRGGIPEHAGKGGRPRVYADKVLAGMVMMYRVSHGLPLEPLTKLTLDDIPGADPSQDGKDR